VATLDSLLLKAKDPANLHRGNGWRRLSNYLI